MNLSSLSSINASVLSTYFPHAVSGLSDCFEKLGTSFLTLGISLNKLYQANQQLSQDNRMRLVSLSVDKHEDHPLRTARQSTKTNYVTTDTLSKAGALPNTGVKIPESAEKVFGLFDKIAGSLAIFETGLNMQKASAGAANGFTNAMASGSTYDNPGAASKAAIGAAKESKPWLVAVTGAAESRRAGLNGIGETRRKRQEADDKHIPRSLLAFGLQRDHTHEYIDNVHRPSTAKYTAEPAPSSRQVPFYSGVAEGRKYGGDAYAMPIPIAADIHVKSMFLPAAATSSDEVKSITKRFPDETFLLGNNLNRAGVMKGRKDFTPEAASAKLYEPKQSMLTNQRTESAIEKSFESILNVAGSERIISQQNVGRGGTAHTKDAGLQPETKTININLNRPMIEHFTITTSTAKEGMNELRHKVEEVLLEILNSASVIH